MQACYAKVSAILLIFSKGSPLSPSLFLCMYVRARLNLPPLWGALLETREKNARILFGGLFFSSLFSAYYTLCKADHFEWTYWEEQQFWAAVVPGFYGRTYVVARILP